MSKWTNKGGKVYNELGMEMANFYNTHYAKQLVREHNAHAELVLCLSAMLKITCGDCHGDNPGNCPADPLACALSAQARAAVAAAKGES